jgi:hypothetical protein
MRKTITEFSYLKRSVKHLQIIKFISWNAESEKKILSRYKTKIWHSKKEKQKNKHKLLNFIPDNALLAIMNK